MKLFFSGAAEQFDEIKEMYAPHLKNGAEVVLAGKSVAIEVEVPQIDDLWNRPFSDYQDSATKALERVTELISAIQKA